MPEAMAEMLKGKDVILVATANYSTPSKSRLNVHFISENLALNGTKVLFVESLGLKDLPIYGISDLLKVLTRAFSFIKMLFHGVKEVKPNLYVLPIPRLPLERFGFIKKLNENIVSFFITKYSKKYLSPSPVLWIFLPTQWYLSKRINNSGVIYHNVDEYSAVPFVDKSYIVTQERKMLRAADIVLTVSAKKIDEFKEYTEAPIIYLNNVANFELFNKAITEKINVPEDIKKILELKKPIIGFVGNLVAYKEDIHLLTQLVEISPEFSFVLIGSVGDGELITNIMKLKTLHNVFLLGPKDYDTLYKYLSFMDVAIIPRRLNAAGEGGFPMKYFEFLAAGIPTVVTGLGNMSQFTKLSKLGGIANNAKQFKERIQFWIDLKKNNPKEYEEGIKVRTKLAKQNSWGKRMTLLNKIVSNVLKD